MVTNVFKKNTFVRNQLNEQMFEILDICPTTIMYEKIEAPYYLINYPNRAVMYDKPRRCIITWKLQVLVQFTARYRYRSADFFLYWWNTTNNIYIVFKM